MKAIGTNIDRQDVLQALLSQEFDLLIIGGGITGAGILLDAQSRGINACLFEMQDFAEGTSSRSTKLIHGGLRYLKQREFKLVKEVGRERTIVEKNAPHITYITPVLVPLYKGGSIGKFTGRIGMKIYDWLAKVKKEDRHKILNRKEALQFEPMLSPIGLKGAIYYPEYRTNDSRLTIEIIKKAVEIGANAINYAKVVEIVYNESEKVNGLIIQDQLNLKKYKIKSKSVINATGPWVDHVCRLDQSKEKKLTLTKGVHIVFSNEKLPLKNACYYDTKDGRMVFAIPSNNKTYVGTTDTIYEGDLSRPNVTNDDANYLLNSINDIFNLSLSTTDIESSWSGLRPLIKQKNASGPSQISRKDEMFCSDSNLISIAGGKLTGYRKMAEKAVNAIVPIIEERSKANYKKCHTESIKLSGGSVGNDKVEQENRDMSTKLGLTSSDLDEIIQLFGSNSSIVLKYIEKEKMQGTEFFLELGKLMYTIDYEFVMSPSDYLIRRTNYLYFNSSKLNKIKDAVIERMHDYFKWSLETKREFSMRLNDEILLATQNFKTQNLQ